MKYLSVLDCLVLQAARVKDYGEAVNNTKKEINALWDEPVSRDPGYYEGLNDALDIISRNMDHLYREVEE